MTDIKEIIGEDYVHSANALFHFMSDAKYLVSALQRRALCPRYCNEDVTYLDIEYNDVKFDKVAVLQKCFCDSISKFEKSATEGKSNKSNVFRERKRLILYDDLSILE